MQESDLWARIRTLADRAHIRMVRIEGADEGVPDVAWCSDAVSGAWLELKVAWPRKTMSPHVEFRRSQVPWLLSWSKAGGKCAVLVGYAGAAHVIPGFFALRLQNEGLVPDLCSASFDLYTVDASERLRDALLRA